MEFLDIIYDKRDGVAKITINRPDVLNALRARTVWELAEALKDAGNDETIGVVVLTGTGNRGFCTGGDERERKDSGGAYPRGAPYMEVHDLMRRIPQPVIAAVNGYAVGHGNILVSLCDLAIASETAKFGQAGPRVGSGSAGGLSLELLARNVGEKRAREIWYLCRLYTAQEAFQMGLINKVVPPEKLEEEAALWCKELLDKSPAAIRRLKTGFNIITDQSCAFERINSLYVQNNWTSEEGREGMMAFIEKRRPDFSRFRYRSGYSSEDKSASSSKK